MHTWLFIWGILFAVTVVAELATLQLVSIWFSAGSLAAFIAAAAGLSPVKQAVIFTAVSILLLAFTRPLLKKLKVRETVPTNADAEVGKLAIVTEEINDVLDSGRVKIGGVHWRARTGTDAVIPAGTPVRVEKISGTTAYVSKVENTVGVS
jgi:membrane protein implicated in regulation of membrane protease activity